MSKNERTSKRVAKIAARVLAIRARAFTGNLLLGYDRDDRGIFISVSDIRALAASCLTQAADRAEREILLKGKLPKGHKRIKTHKPVFRNHRARRS